MKVLCAIRTTKRRNSIGEKGLYKINIKEKKRKDEEKRGKERKGGGGGERERERRGRRLEKSKDAKLKILAFFSRRFVLLLVA